MSYSIKPAMSISYVKDISDGRGLNIFFKLLSRWKGSLYKLVWIDLLIYLVAYFSINFIYRFGLDDQKKKTFHAIVHYCTEMKRDIPISFLIGFFVSGVIGRWYMMYLSIPWLSKAGFVTMSLVTNRDDEYSRTFKMTVCRYLNLAWVLVMRRVSDQIRERFLLEQDTTIPDEGAPLATDETKEYSPINEVNPLLIPDEYEFENDRPVEENVALRQVLMGFNNDPKVRATYGKLITNSEIKAFEKLANDCFKRNRVPYVPEFWVPLQWAVRVIQHGIVHNMFSDIKVAFFLIDEVNKIRQAMQDLRIITSIMLPLVYAQVVIIAVAAYFICLLFSSQFIETKASNDLYFPFFMVLSFLFIDGWLKVALCILNPFGDDDEDFQTNDILDYNLEFTYRVSYGERSHYPNHLHLNTKPITTDRVTEDEFIDFLTECEKETSANLRLTSSTSNLEVKSKKKIKAGDFCLC